MKNRLGLFIIGVLFLGAALLLLSDRSATKRDGGGEKGAGHDEHAHATSFAKESPPAFQTADEARQLAPTLPPSEFFGKAREAYRVAQEIPTTLAQLPCYCHCDKSFGHKSLHTCFVDDHASHCAVCVDEALLAYRLQKEEKLTPAEVRQRIIEQYSEME